LRWLGKNGKKSCPSPADALGGGVRFGIIKGGGKMKASKKIKNKMGTYLDGEGAFPATEKEFKKWIKKYLPSEHRPTKRR
jgi:hypothetical protein